MSDKTITPIEQYWGRDDATVKGERLSLAVRRLQTQAEGYLVETQEAVLNAQSTFDKARADSVKKPDFGAIVRAAIAVKTAELTASKARLIYSEMFGTEPKI